MRGLRRQPPNVDDVVERASALAVAAITMGRLSALAGISEAELDDKLRQAKVTVEWLEAGVDVLRVRNEHLATHARTAVRWPEYALPGIASGEPVDAHWARKTYEEVGAATWTLARALNETLRQTPLLPWPERKVRRVLKLAEQTCGEIPRRIGSSDLVAERMVTRPRTERSSTVVRRIRGPIQSPLPESVRRDQSLAEVAAPAYAEDLRDAVPYMWCLAIREAMASDLCLLTLAEYDGLPLEFYVEFGKQALDEAGHALFFMEAIQTYMDELEAQLDGGEEEALGAVLKEYRLTGRGLPVPREGNLYEAIWSAGLPERLVLMHHDTEGPAVRTLEERLGTAFCESHPIIANGFKITRYDEISHTGIGGRWLRYLYPDVRVLKDVIAGTRRMRGMLLLSSFAEHGGKSLAELVDAGQSAHDSAARSVVEHSRLD